MQIELRNVKIGPNSEETTNFRADIFINGKKAGYCSNYGHGGPTDFHAYDDAGKELIKEAEAYAKTLPPVELGEELGSVPKDLESVIDDLLYQHQLKKDLKRYEKKNIVFGNPKTGSIQTLGWQGSHTIEGMKQSEAGRTAIQKVVDKILTELKPGEFILNTNIDEFLPKPEVS